MDNIYSPIVRTQSSVVPIFERINITNLFSVTDFDANSEVTRIRIRDNGVGAGNFMRAADTLEANIWHEFPASDLGVLDYRGGPGFATELFSIQVFDGVFWSNIASDIITTDKTKAVVTARPGRTAANEMVRLDQFFDVTDADGRYDLRLPAGTARLYFNSLPDGFAYPRPQIVKRLDVQPGQAAIENLNFTLQRKSDDG